MQKNTGRLLLTIGTGAVLLTGGIWLGIHQFGGNDPADSDVILAGPTGAGDPEETPSATPIVVPTPAELTIDEVLAMTPAQEAAEALVEQVVAVPPQDGTVGDDLSLVVADSLASQLDSLALEYLDHGWVATGSPKVTDVEIDEQEDGTIIVSACIDSRDVEVKDGGGNVVSAEHPPTLNLFTMEEREGRWLLIDQTFPAEPNC